MRRALYGVTGSGKTTLARRIGEVAGLPVHELDQLTWTADPAGPPIVVLRSRADTGARLGELWSDDLRGSRSYLAPVHGHLGRTLERGAARFDGSAAHPARRVGWPSRLAREIAR